VDEQQIEELSRDASMIRSAAREHKRAADHHRRQSRSLMQRFNEIVEQCEARGIHLKLTETPGRES
jgi:Na+/phosphate symporter